MNFICWNCWGTTSKGFAGLVKNMKREYSTSIIALLETHTSGTQAKRIIKRIGFENQFIEEARGQAGGIWLLWDASYWKIQSSILPLNLFMWKLVGLMRLPGTSLLCMAILTTLKDRCYGTIFKNSILILMVLGRCLVILMQFLKLMNVLVPPRSSPQRNETGFQNMVDNCNLIVLGFHGDSYTWARGNTRKRLDRAFGNLEWRLRFENTEIYHLPKLKSDHAPLLMAFDDRRPANRRRRPFRFEAVWLTHPSFDKLVKDY